MPTYAYECTKCGHYFEEFQSISAKPLESCPKCSQPLKRLIGGGASIICKGSGSHSSDFKRKHMGKSI